MPATKCLRRRATSIGAAFAVVALVHAPGPSTAAGTWEWLVAGPVIEVFDPPDSPFGSGHRGIDVAAAPETPIVAPAAGTVKFAGPIGGQRFLSIVHGGGWESTASWVSTLLVRKGDAVFAGQLVATTGAGHPASDVPHVHLGVKFAGDYVDPLTVYGPLPVPQMIRLVPIVPVDGPAGPFRPTGPPLGWAVRDPGEQRSGTVARRSIEACSNTPVRSAGCGWCARGAHARRRVGPRGPCLASVPTGRRAHRLG